METTTPTNRYFVKELVSNRVYSTKGYQIPFDDIGDDTGLLITSHPGLISEIMIAIERKRGGIREVSEAEVEELKKKAFEHQLHRNELSTNRFDQARIASTRPFNPNPSPPTEAAVGAEVVKPPPPIPGQPLDPVQILDPAALRPKSAKKKVKEQTAAVIESLPAIPIPPPPP